MRYLIPVSIVTFLTQSQHALANDKAEKVKKTVREQCGKELAESDLLRAMKALFLCTARQVEELDSCQIKCSKESSGSMVGN